MGKSGILAMQIWVKDVNARGGLLGRPVKLTFHDNESSPANVPGLYVVSLPEFAKSGEPIQPVVGR